MNQTFENLKAGKKLYFASDFHLGAPDQVTSWKRERKIVAWLDAIQEDAAGIFLVGDLFDFWFEYKHAIPKGFIRFQGKLAELTDSGIPIVFFTGNHDMWMFDYFTQELGIPIYRKPKTFQAGNKLLYVGHGDGLGPGDRFYKFIKWFFASKACQWLFKWLHPNIGMGIAHFWSSKSRISNDNKEDTFKGEAEWLYIFCKEMETKKHHDYYIFGHRHLPMDLEVCNNSRYFNLGEWVNHFTYVEFDGEKAQLVKFKEKA